MEIVALVALAGNAEQEATRLAADLGLTVYETQVMLRAPLPVIILRTEDRARTLDIVGKVRARGHDVVALDLAQITWTEEMFRPKTFRFEGEDLVGEAHGETRRLPLNDVFALLRAVHMTQSDETITTKVSSPSLGRAAMTGGLMMTKTTSRETTRTQTEREPVLYVFRGTDIPWLLASQALRYDGLGAEMKVSKTENFEVLLRVLRERLPTVPYDTRLLQVRPATTVVNAGAKSITQSSAHALDILAHVVASALNRQTRPYR